ncbi:MAG: alpha/beta hydrolase [Verrucomicrobiales bacterium]|nr:alpha/beta hydrolase [Verrucomicrobiales bacterium]
MKTPALLITFALVLALGVVSGCSRAAKAPPPLTARTVPATSEPVECSAPEISSPRIEGSTWFWIDLPDNLREDVWMWRPSRFGNHAEFSDALAQDIRKRPDRSVLIGVHGFCNTFEFAGRRLAKMVHDMNYHGTPVLYRWPAGEGIKDYGRDEDLVAQPDALDNSPR